MKKATNGDRARDVISGFEGTVVCESRWISGCKRLTIQPPGLDEKGQPYVPLTFDEDQVEIIEGIKDTGTPSGGPAPEPVQQAGPER